jgi:hypothetical protein
MGIASIAILIRTNLLIFLASRPISAGGLRLLRRDLTAKACIKRCLEVPYLGEHNLANSSIPNESIIPILESIESIALPTPSFGEEWQQISKTSLPVPRWGAVTWTDAAGLLWMFGGQDGGNAFLNDLWKFNPATQIWTQVTGGFNQNGVYGTKGTPAAGNLPGGRWGATGRVDGSGNVWLFGGYGYDSTSATPGLLNDLWKFSGGQWTWVSGGNTTNQNGVYGTLGTAAAANVPGGRQASTSWVDASGNFWVFGGYNLSPTGQPNAFNDLWEFSGGQWKWASGANVVNQTGTYGTQGTAATGNTPARAGAWLRGPTRTSLVTRVCGFLGDKVSTRPATAPLPTFGSLRTASGLGLRVTTLSVRMESTACNPTRLFGLM